MRKWGAIALFRFLPYKKIYGVELNTHLHQKAQKNFGSKALILNDDARNFNQYVDYVYMFNPFPSVVIIKTLRNLFALNKNLIIIYRNPVYFEKIKNIFDVKEIIRMNSSSSAYICFRLKANNDL